MSLFGNHLIRDLSSSTPHSISPFPTTSSTKPEQDVDGLKYLCREVIPAGRAEKITRAFEFFSELERLNLLSEENRDFLASKLIAINRNDLRNKLLGIQENHSVSQTSQGRVASAQLSVPNSWDDKPVPEDLVYDLVEDLSVSWKMLGRRLGLTEGVISNIDLEYRKVVEKGVAMFEEWKRRKSGDATMKALRKGLELIGRRDLSERVRDFALRKMQEEIDAAVEHEHQSETAEQRPFPNLVDMGHALPSYPLEPLPGEQPGDSSLRPLPPHQSGWTPSNQNFPPFSAPPVATGGLDPSNQRFPFTTEQRPFPNLDGMGHASPNYPTQQFPGEQNFPPFSAPPVTTGGLDPSNQLFSFTAEQRPFAKFSDVSQASLNYPPQQFPGKQNFSSFSAPPVTTSGLDPSNQRLPLWTHSSTPAVPSVSASQRPLVPLTVGNVAPQATMAASGYSDLSPSIPTASVTGQLRPSSDAINQRSQTGSTRANPSLHYPVQISQPSTDPAASGFSNPQPSIPTEAVAGQHNPPSNASNQRLHTDSTLADPSLPYPVEISQPSVVPAASGFSNPQPFISTEAVAGQRNPLNNASNQRLHTDSTLADPSLPYPVEISQPSIENPSLQSPPPASPSGSELLVDLTSTDAEIQEPPDSTSRQILQPPAAGGAAGQDVEDHPPNEGMEGLVNADLKAQLSTNGNYLDPEKYDPIKMIGSGGFAKVYLCQCRRTGKRMAVKMCDLGTNHSETQKQTKAVENEVKVLSAVKHKFIVQFFHTEENRNTMLLFLEYMEGGSVEDMLRHKGPLDELLVRKFTWQILIGLEFLHSKGIIHKDIKGGNILLDRQQQNIKIVDFGISKVMTVLKTVTGGRVTKGNVASFHWTSPEMLSDLPYGRKTDIWSVGCTVVEMLTTKPPLFDDHLEMPTKMFKIVNHQVEPPKGCTSLAFGFLEKCFSKQEVRPTATVLLKDDPFVQFSPEEMRAVF